MKYKLTESAIEELKAMEFEEKGQTNYEIISDCIDNLYDGWVNTQGFELFEIVAEKLPKPRLKSIDDFVALEGWEYQWEHTPHWIWWASKITCNSLEELYTAKIRQIDMPENEYLVKDCIEQETKEPISIADYQAHKDREFEAKVREIIKKVLKEEAGE